MEIMERRLSVPEILRGKEEINPPPPFPVIVAFVNLLP